MKKFLKALAVMASASMLVLGIFGCSDDGGSSGGENDLATLTIKGDTSVMVGNSIQLTCEGTTNPITWTSSKKSIADVSGTGLVEGVGEGIAVITASASGAKSASVNITVTSEPQTPDETPIGTDSTPTATEKEAGLEAATGDIWVAGNGATITKNDDGSITVATTEDGIAAKLSDAKMAELNLDYANGFYIEAMIRQDNTSSTKGGKNFGIASHITAEGDYYYYGINYNGRGQIGTKTNAKGLQLGSLASNTNNFSKTGEWIKIRYEYSGDTAKKVTGYFNDIQQVKSDVVDYEIKTADQKESGSIGFVGCANTFTFKNFKVGPLTEKSPSILMTSTYEFDTLQGDKKYIMMMNNDLYLRKGDEFTVEVVAKDSTGADTEWTVGSSNEAVLTVEKSGTSFTVKAVEAMKEGDTAVVTLVSGTEKRTFTVLSIKYVSSYEDVDYEAPEMFTPALNATGIYEDTKLVITFDSEPSLAERGEVYIFEESDLEKPIDTISIGSESDTVGGTNLTLKNFMIQVEGNSIYITPHHGKIQNNKTYVVGIPKYVLTGKINGKIFKGFDPAQKRWKFTTRDTKPTVTDAVRVGSSDAAQFRTIQGAIDALPSAANTIITVEKGTYLEVIQSTKLEITSKVTIIGDTDAKYGADVVIKGINCNSYNGGTSTRASFYWKTGDLYLKNVTIQNAYDRNVDGTAQSEAIFMQGNKLVAYNCSFKGYQDTIQTQAKSWFYKCYIEGDTDFIWGQIASGVCLIEESEIKMLNTNDDKVKASESFIFETRIGSINENLVSKGFVLLNSTVEATHGGGNYLARRATAKTYPTTYYDQAAFINCAFSGTPGLSNKLWGGPNVKSDKNEPEFIAKDSAGNMNVGWKIYGGSGWNKSGVNAEPYFGTITEAVYTAEYSGRKLIANRVYNKTTEAYQNAENVWDLDAEAEALGFTPTADNTVLPTETITTKTWNVIDKFTGSEAAGSEILDGSATLVSGKLNPNANSKCCIVNADTVIQMKEQGEITLSWYDTAQAQYGTDDNAKIVYKDGLATITFKSSATSGGSGIYLRLIMIDYENIPTDTPTVAEYSVVFNYNGNGQENDSFTVEEGETVSAPAIPIRSGFAFLGWFDAETAGNKVTFPATITADTTYYAHWEELTAPVVIERTATITFGSKGNYGTYVASTALDMSGIGDEFRDNGGDNCQLPGTIKILVKEGAKITVASYPSYTNYTVKVAGGTPSAAQTGTSYEFTVNETDSGKDYATVEFTSTNNNNYFYSIAIAYEGGDVIEEDAVILFGTGNSSSENYYTNWVSLGKLEITNINDSSNASALAFTGTLTIKVKEGATVVVSGFDAGNTHYTATVNGTNVPLDANGYDCTISSVESDSTIVLTRTDGNNYIRSITVTYN